MKKFKNTIHLNYLEFEVKGKYNELLLKKIPKCCEIVKVEIKEVKDDE